jgi:DNA-binding transcriptional LysR family regulator
LFPKAALSWLLNTPWI